jgi:peptidoglycan biosynthesis protein MviN/MurJ (putative lipid II flippase)
MLPDSEPGQGAFVDLVIGFLRHVGIFLGSLVAAALIMGLVAWLVMIPMGRQLLESGAGPVAGALVTVLTIVLGGLIYRDIIEREDRDRYRG